MSNLTLSETVTFGKDKDKTMIFNQISFEDHDSVSAVENELVRNDNFNYRDSEPRESMSIDGLDINEDPMNCNFNENTSSMINNHATSDGNIASVYEVETLDTTNHFSLMDDLVEHDEVLANVNNADRDDFVSSYDGILNARITLHDKTDDSEASKCDESTDFINSSGSSNCGYEINSFCVRSVGTIQSESIHSSESFGSMSDTIMNSSDSSYEVNLSMNIRRSERKPVPIDLEKKNLENNYTRTKMTDDRSEFNDSSNPYGGDSDATSIRTGEIDYDDSDWSIIAYEEMKRKSKQRTLEDCLDYYVRK